MYTRNFNIPIINRLWVNTGIVVSSGDSLRITATGQGGIRGGVNGQPAPNGNFWPVYPEGVYQALQDAPAAEPYPVHAYEPQNVRNHAGTGIGSPNYVVSNATPFSLTGVIRPDTNPPDLYAGAVNDGFSIDRSRTLLSGNHGEGVLYIIFNDLSESYADNYGTFNVMVEVEEWEEEEPVIDYGDYNPLFQIFNDSSIGESAGSPRWSTVRMGTEISEVRRAFRSRPQWILNLSNVTLSPEQYEELLAFQFINEGMLHDFLCRNSRQCMFETFGGKPSLQGFTGDNEDNIFQLRKERKNQGRTRYESIRYPNWKYPRMLDMNGRPWTVLPEIQIYVGGDGTGRLGHRGTLVSEMKGFDVEINGGQIQLPPSIPDGLRVDAYGGYLMRMVCNQDEIPVKLVSGIFKIDNGVTFSEVIEDNEDELDVA
jgi:hypothetical protein